MDKKDRLMKLHVVYMRVQSWIRDNAGKSSPSDINIAQSILREIEEMTVWVDGQDQKFTQKHMRRLNDIWKQYK
jgi:hypothetical protein